MQLRYCSLLIGATKTKYYDDGNWDRAYQGDEVNISGGGEISEQDSRQRKGAERDARSYQRKKEQVQEKLLWDGSADTRSKELGSWEQDQVRDAITHARRVS